MSIESELKTLSYLLNIPFEWLYKIIKFESNFNPKAKNPLSSARGIIQIIDSTARGLGYKSSLDMVQRNPTVIKQIREPVRKYFLKKMPFTSKSNFYMSVFYPIYRNKHLFTEFPKHVQSVNPGIKTIYDYVNKVDKVLNLDKYYKLLFFILLLMYGGYKIVKKKQGNT